MVDLSYLESFTKGNTTKMKRYINMYLGITPDIFEQMGKHIADQDWEQLRIKAHSLKPQADYMGIPDLKAALVEIEQRVEDGKFEGLDELYEQAILIHADSVPQLKAFIDTP